MAIRVDCGYCGRIHNLGDQFAGKRIRCVACKTPIEVPGPTVAEAEPAEATPAPAAPAAPTGRNPGQRPERRTISLAPEKSDSWQFAVPTRAGKPKPAAAHADDEDASEPAKRRRSASTVDEQFPAPTELQDEDPEPVTPWRERRRLSGRESKGKKPKESKGKRRQSDSPSVVARIAKSVGVTLLVLLSIAAAVGKAMRRSELWNRTNQRHAGAPDDREPLPMDPRAVARTLELARPADSDKLFPVSQAPQPYFPDFEQRPGEHYLIFAGYLGQAGGRMSLRVYIPRVALEPHSLPCVLVAPAGTNMLTGMRIGDSDRPEHLPYLEAGYVVVCYSLDGDFDKSKPNATDREWADAYVEFVAAHAGVTNARNALEFVLERVPAVDPNRIYSAGHSSAAAMSLLFAAHEPRLKGCIAYAPITDLERQYRELLADPEMPGLLPGIATLARRMSPKTHAASINCPVFLFCAQDDRPEVVGDFNRFAQQLSELGKEATICEVPTGGHYHSMLAEGIPQATAWLRTLPGNESAGLAPATLLPDAPGGSPAF